MNGNISESYDYIKQMPIIVLNTLSINLSSNVYNIQMIANEK
jgi:hypothetical protein